MYYGSASVAPLFSDQYIMFGTMQTEKHKASPGPENSHLGSSLSLWLLILQCNEMHGKIPDIDCQVWSSAR